ncbi:MAG: tyrosine-type recombinase/integrase [Pseudomonadota bacterium]
MSKKTVWNKGKVVGVKVPLSKEQVALVKMMLSEIGNLRDLALFSLGVDTSLRACDLVALRVSDVLVDGEVVEVLSVLQKKTGLFVKCYLIPYTREVLKDFVRDKALDDFLFTGQKKTGLHITAGTYRGLLKSWLLRAGIDAFRYSTHSVRRTKPSFIYSKTQNLRACQKQLGHSSIHNTQNYLGIEEQEALKIAKQWEI